VLRSFILPVKILSLIFIYVSLMKTVQQYLKLAAKLTVTGLLLTSLAACSSSDKDGLSESELNGGSRFGSGSIPLAEGEGMFRDIHFDYDSSSIDSMGRQDVEYNASVLKNNNGLSVIVEGHCDERGTNEYNMALGASRAKAVERALVSLGVSSSSLDTISYGEEVPLDPSHSEAAWAKNRRVHLSASKQK
jgi:peptidoglycan-associated lipoprotein